MYLDIETLDSTSGDCENFQIKEDFDLPHKCPVIHINLVHKTPTLTDNNCCRDIAVFESISELNLSEKVETVEEGVVDKNQTDNVLWKEAKVFIRGFKDVFVKGRSIWED